MSSVETSQTPAEPAAPTRIPAFGAATPIIVIVGILVVSVVTWWLLGDSEWSVTSASSPVVSCVLFWTILGFIVTGFTFASWPFTKIAQPLSGYLQIVVNIVSGVVMTLVFTRGIGSWDPTFSADAPGGVGYTAAAFIVLIGFYAYTLAAANCGGYPFESVSAPLASVAQFFLAAFITTIGVVVLVYPNFNAQLAPNAPVALTTALGWVYSSIVIAIVSAMQWGNAPWAWIKDRHLRALGAVIVTLGGGYVLMKALEVVVKLLDPKVVVDAATYSASAQTAQLGVCVSLCSLLGGLVVAPFTPETSKAASTRVCCTNW